MQIEFYLFIVPLLIGGLGFFVKNLISDLRTTVTSLRTEINQMNIILVRHEGYTEKQVELLKNKVENLEKEQDFIKKLISEKK